MAKKRTFTLSEQTVTRFKTAADRVLGQGGAIGTSRPVIGSATLIGRWCQLTSSETSTFAHDKRVYTADLYPALGATAADGEIKVLNSFELKNTASKKSGYDIESSPECGDIIGIEPLPTGVPFQIVDVIYVAGVKYAVISCRNDPKFEEE